MRLIKGFYMALGMFISIPLPFFIWDESLTAIMIVSFPLVGAIIGALWWGASVLLLSPNFPTVIVAALLTVAPFVIAGFIHLDGFMDTSDALLSRRPLEDKLRIIKDPNVGAFAVVMLGILFLLQFAAMYTVADGGRFLALLIVICVLSRCFSVFAIFFMPHISISNYTAMLGKNVRVVHRAAVVIIALGAVGFGGFYAGLPGLIVSGAVAVGFAWAMRVVYRDFKGISGDLLGYAMVIGEVFGLIALALLQNVEAGIWF